MIASELLTGDLIDGRSIIAHVTANGGKIADEVRTSARRMMWLVTAVNATPSRTIITASAGTFIVPSHVSVNTLRQTLADHGEYVLG